VKTPKRQPLETELIRLNMSAVMEVISTSLALDADLVETTAPEDAPFEPVEGKGR